jgi:hypothetical protein
MSYLAMRVQPGQAVLDILTAAQEEGRTVVPGDGVGESTALKQNAFMSRSAKECKETRFCPATCTKCRC